jgi:hypothetical protein
MKFEIDTIEKTIKLLEDVNMKELNSTLKSMLVDWKEYTILYKEDSCNYIPYSFPYYEIEYLTEQLLGDKYHPIDFTVTCTTNI